MAKPRLLSKSFRPKKYELVFLKADGKTIGRTKIIGNKVGKPSKRLTFHQKGLKILRAKVTKRDKRGEQEVDVLRINHHKSFEEVRLHASKVLYPGEYKVEIEYQIRTMPSNISALSRLITPMVDEPGMTTEYIIQDAKD